MNISKLKRVVVAGAFLVGLSMMGSTSFANPIDVKLPQGMLMIANNPPSIYMESGGRGVASVLLDKGLLKANVYQLQVKRENNFYYGIAGDVQLGNLTIGTLIPRTQDIVTTSVLIGKKPNSKESLELLRQVARGLENLDEKGSLKLQYEDDTKTYSGVAKLNKYIDGVYYQNHLHVVLYQDRNYGPSVRFVALDAKHDTELYPELAKIMKVTK